MTRLLCAGNQGFGLPCLPTAFVIRSEAVPLCPGSPCGVPWRDLQFPRLQTNARSRAMSCLPTQSKPEQTRISGHPKTWAFGTASAVPNQAGLMRALEVCDNSIFKLSPAGTAELSPGR
jgi:hypothetical protein